MSTKHKNITKIQERIIDALANDFEDIGQISKIMESKVSTKNLKDEIWKLIQGGFVSCFSAVEKDMKSIARPDKGKLTHYWFALSKSGEELLIPSN